MMPNALKLSESVNETAKEVTRECLEFSKVLVAVSSGTIAAGVLRGLYALTSDPPSMVIHMGYDRSEDELRRYIESEAGGDLPKGSIVVNEKYDYKDQATDGITPPFPCNSYYDLKAFRWWTRKGYTDGLFWNIG